MICFIFWQVAPLPPENDECHDIYSRSEQLIMTTITVSVNSMFLHNRRTQQTREPAEKQMLNKPATVQQQ
jgi:hypothetical protein